MFSKPIQFLSLLVVLTTIYYPQLRPESFTKYDSVENFIRDSSFLIEKLRGVARNGENNFPLKFFLLGDSYFASGELAGYFEKQISDTLGKAGEILLSSNKKFPDSINREKFLVTSRSGHIKGFHLLTGTGPDQIKITAAEGINSTFTIDSSNTSGIFVSFSKPLKSFYLSPVQNVPNIAVSGIVLRYSTQGVISSYLGVESASLRTYNNQLPGVFRLLQLIQPDVLIINLGINDCAGPNFTSNYADVELKYLLKKLRAVVPGAALLFISPPAFCVKKNGRLTPSPSVDIFRERLNILAAKEGFAWWDMKAVMGGDSSMAQWVKAGLAISDHIHLTTHGMSLIARLLSGAIVDLYRKED